jgi:hypothetical protein
MTAESGFGGKPTDFRLRDYPITPDKLIDGLPEMV